MSTDHTESVPELSEELVDYDEDNDADDDTDSDPRHRHNSEDSDAAVLTDHSATEDNN
ncbi:hypothetical protein BGZ82_004369, partial [Podila clonocystis]